MSCSIEVMEDCASAFGIYDVPGSRPGTTWRVELHGETYAHCSCPAFTYFKGDAMDRTCKHIRWVFDHACLGNQQWREAKENPEARPVGLTCDAFTGNRCLCGERLVAVRRAV